MLTPNRRAQILVICLLLFLPIAFLQSRIDPLHPQFMPGSNNGLSHLPIEFALGGVTGFREAIAGLLWVRCDEFFHEGDYDAVKPMIRIITWLDPHQIDVYETGAWHMDYNFTDAQQRSDRRYIPLSIALMKEGIVNNPTVAEMYGDLGFTHFFRKIEDYPQAADQFAQGQVVAQNVKDDYAKHPHDLDLQDEAKDAAHSVTTISHSLAHTYEAEGMIDQAEKQWQYCISAHQDNMAKNLGNGPSSEQSGLRSSQRLLREMQMRVKWRARDTKAPVDMKFNPILVRVAPKVFVLEGTMNAIGSKNFVLETGNAEWGPADGCRVEIRLQDAGYQMPVIHSFSLSTLNLNATTTIMQDAASVTKGKIGGDPGRTIDMSQDTEIYSFAAPRYTVTMWFNPANPNDCPPNIQDRIGWRGEGMTDAHYLDTSGQVPGDTSTPIPGLRMLKKTIVLTRDDIMGQGRKVFQ